MKKKQLREPEAWREVARRIAEGDWPKFGMCGVVNAMNGAGVIGARIANKMHQRVQDHLHARFDAAVNARTGRGVDGFPSLLMFDLVGVVDTRVLAALFLGQEAASEKR